MVNFSRDIDFNKYKTFFLSYYKDSNGFENHMVRPCSSTYEEITSTTNKFKTYTLEGAILSFNTETSIAEILIECAIRGITLDFIDIYVKKDKRDRWSEEYELAQVIDTHKEDINNYLDKIEAKRYYVAKNTNKRDILKFLVIDRFSQDSKIDFLKGEYDKKAIIAGFKEYNNSSEYCLKMNKN